LEFQTFLARFLDAWSQSSLEELSGMICDSYQAREITSTGEVLDFGYEESIQGWKQGFQFVRERESEWVLKTVSTIPLRDDETMAVISASMIIDGQLLETANLFFDTFKEKDGEWKLVRSYVEAGIQREQVTTAP
jgi:hypothetical protein